MKLVYTLVNGELNLKAKADVKKLMYSWDKKLWIEDIGSKSSLNIYRRFKTDICEEDIYDNRPSSRILNKARTNTLQLNDRNRHVNKETPLYGMWRCEQKGRHI